VLEREAILAALWKRMAAVSGVARTARNPVDPPSLEDLPCINMFELQDKVVGVKKRGASLLPEYRREVSVALEVFVAGSSEPQSSQALGLFVQDVKRKLYEGGVTLGLKGVEVEETDASQILRPSKMDSVAGIGILLKIKYVEDVTKLEN